MSLLILLFQKYVRKIKLKYYQLDPYFEQVNVLINYNVVPFRSLADLKAGKTDWLIACKIGFYIGVMLVNLIRFTIIAFFEHTNIVQQYFFVFFAESANHSVLYLTMILNFLAPTILCNFNLIYSFF